MQSLQLPTCNSTSHIVREKHYSWFVGLHFMPGLKILVTVLELGTQFFQLHLQFIISVTQLLQSVQQK